MNCKLTPTVITAFVLFAALGVHAGPVTTVPWNGYTGAVSFTYDDGRPSQLPTLVPQLDQTGIKATFFLASGIYDFKASAWASVAKKGHELANHTSDHTTPGSNNVKSMAATLRAIDPVVEAVTLAYPGCGVGGTNYVSAESFIARGCGTARYKWSGLEPNGSQPDWMNVQGVILSKAVKPGLDAVDAAKSENSWAVMVVHDVENNPRDYSLSPADNKKILDQAIANKLWIGTYQEVGAYYRAHFTMDKVTAASGSGPWNLTWTSPHAKMPKSVKLKVKLDAATFGTSFTVSQDNVTIPANTDGSYTVNFMKLKMNVTKGSTGVREAAHRALSSIETNLVRDGISLKGLSGEVEASLVDPRGTTLFHGTVAGLVPFDRDRVQGIVVLRLTDRATGAVAQRALNTIR